LAPPVVEPLKSPPTPTPKGVSFARPPADDNDIYAQPLKSPLLKGRVETSSSGQSGSGSSSAGGSSSASTSVLSAFELEPTPPPPQSSASSLSPDSALAAGVRISRTGLPAGGYATPVQRLKARGNSGSGQQRESSVGLVSSRGDLYTQAGVATANESESPAGRVGGANGAGGARLSRDFVQRNGQVDSVYPGSARAGAAAKKKAKEKERKARERERRIQTNAKHLAKLEFEELERERKQHADAKKNAAAAAEVGTTSSGGQADRHGHGGHGGGSASSDSGEPTPRNFKQLGGAALGGFMVGGPVGLFAGAGAALLWDAQMRDREKKRALVEAQERRLKRLSRQNLSQNNAFQFDAAAGGGPPKSPRRSKRAAADDKGQSGAATGLNPGPAASAKETIEQVAHGAQSTAPF
jgi:hypothetical protein